MRRKSLVCAIALLLSGLAPALAHAQGMEEVVADQIARACEGNAGTFQPPGIVEKDLTGDGQADLLLNHAYVDCNGARASTCGMRACAVSIFVARDGGLHPAAEWDSVGVDVGPQTPPVIRLTSHDLVEVALRWSGMRFEQVSDDQLAAWAEEQEGRWVYGMHSVIGLAAHVVLGTNAVGLACAEAADPPPGSDVLSLRMTPEAAGSAPVAVMFDSRPGVSDISHMEERMGYYELKGDSCTLHLDAFRRANAMQIAPGYVERLDSTPDGEPIVHFRQGDAAHILRPGVDPATVLQLERIVPLAGSARAIGALIEACAPLRRDIENNCGL